MLDGKSVLVTGGAGALGQAVVGTLVNAGARVAVADRPGPLQTAELPASALSLEADLLDPESAASAVTRTVSALGALDGLVCLAGGFFGDTPVLDTPPDRMRQQFELNVMTAYTIIQAALPTMIERGGGSIVCVSSRPAVSVVPGSVAYATSKLGVLKLVDLVAAEYRERGVRANAILPSIIDTPANRQAMPRSDHSRWVRPEQIARVIQFLVSDDSEVVSGAHIPVYGQA
ncbi:MAG: SDR family NAD(P)-dependent oxidoreductase [Dehalococcoidia bacterium]